MFEPFYSLCGRPRHRSMLAVATLAVILCVPRSEAQIPDDADTTEDETSTDSERRGRSLFEEGVMGLEAGDLEEALRAFEESHREHPTAAALYNVALLLVDLDRKASAWNRFREYLALDAELAIDKRRDVELLMGELASGVGLVDFLISPETAEVSVDGESLDNGTNTTLALDPGSHVVTIEADAYRPLEIDLSPAAGSRRTLSRSLTPIPSVTPLSSTDAAPEIIVGPPNNEPTEDDESSNGSVFASPFFWLATLAVVGGATAVAIWLALDTDDPFKDVDDQAFVLTSW